MEATEIQKCNAVSSYWLNNRTLKALLQSNLSAINVGIQLFSPAFLPLLMPYLTGRAAHLRMRFKYRNYSRTFAAFSWRIQEETSFCNRKIKIEVELYFKQIVYIISPKEISNYFTVINVLLLKLMLKIRVEEQSNLNFPIFSKPTLVVDLSS